MKRGIVASVAVLLLGSCVWSTPVRADGPELAVNAGVAVPLKKYSHTVEEVGGTTGLSAGYRFYLTDNLALSLLANRPGRAATTATSAARCVSTASGTTSVQA